MTAPTGNERQVPPYVALIRIAAVVGMSATAAFGIFLLLLGGGYWPWALLSIALALPFFFVMRLAENLAEPAPDEPPES